MHRSKVRKRFHNLPIHQRNKLLDVHVDRSIRKDVGRTTRVRLGDVVRVMRGDYAGKEGKVIGLDTKTGRVYIEGISRKNASGKERSIGIHASKLMLISRGEGSGK
ncbi:MAG: 50S ribosomal protein L24 [Candidatus Micrarchaeota archaeon]|nr:50S ribosomal protein L24 [Candidatus Micrarchaeota archaeon]MCX8154691.1 50S ribosomal protein L24 [Candidatus Micrarchaeota archaeon]